MREREEGGRFKGMNECGNVRLLMLSYCRILVPDPFPEGGNALYRTGTLTGLLICRAR